MKKSPSWGRAAAWPTLALCPAVLAWVAAAPACAAEAELDAVMVTATRSPMLARELLADVSLITRDEIVRSGAVGVADVLARQPGIEVSRNGGPGTTTSVFVRGGNSQHTAVYVDGVRIDTQSGSGGAAWESLPLDQIDRIEILRGPAAAVYGSDAIHGVIQLFTRRGAGPATPSLRVGAGSQGLRDVQASVRGSAGDQAALDYAISVSAQTRDGFDVQPLRLRTPSDGVRNPDRDGDDTRALSARLGWQLDARQRLEATLLASNVDAQYDDFSYNPSRPKDDLSRHRLRASGLSWIAQWTPSYTTRLSLSDSSEHYETTPSPYQTQTRLRGYGLHSEGRWGPHRVGVILERREDQLDNSATGGQRTRSQNAIGLSYGWMRGAHNLQINARHDDDSGFGGHSTGNLAYGYQLTPQWRARAATGTAFRAPTLYQRFSAYGVSDLQPETSRNAEAGLHYAQGRTALDAVLYRNTVRHMIAFVSGAGPCASPFGCYASVAQARYEGLTLSAADQWGSVRVQASLDWQRPRDLDRDKDLPRRARRHGTLKLDVPVGAWRLGAELQASGQRFDDAANQRVLPGYALLNLSASTTLGRGWTLLARLDNLTDQDYQLARTYATAGRSVYLGLSWTPR